MIKTKDLPWTTDPEFLQANDLIENGRLDEAAVILNKYLTENPESIGAWNMLRAIHWPTKRNSCLSRGGWKALRTQHRSENVRSGLAGL